MVTPGKSDAIRVEVGVKPSPNLAAETAAVAQAIQTGLQSNMRGITGVMQGALTGISNVGHAMAGKIRGAFGSVAQAFGSDMLGMVGGVAAIGGFGRALSGTVGAGIKFNDTIEGVRIGLAGMLRQMQPGMFRTWEMAIGGAERIMSGLKIEALTTVATFQDLAEATQGLIGPILSSGIPLEKASATAALMARATSALMPWARGGQIIQEGRALMTGNINQNAFIANALGITREQVMEARRAGRMYEFLTEKLGAFNRASSEAANTLNGLTSNLRDAFEFAMAEASEGVFSELKSFVSSVKEYVGGPEFKGMARDIISGFADALEGARTVMETSQPAVSALRDFTTYWGTFIGTLWGNVRTLSWRESPMVEASEAIWRQRAIRGGSATGQAEAVALLEDIRDALRGTVKVEVPGV